MRLSVMVSFCVIILGALLVSSPTSVAAADDVRISPTQGPGGTVVHIFSTSSCPVTPIPVTISAAIYFDNKYLRELEYSGYCSNGLDFFWVIDAFVTIPSDASPGSHILKLIPLCSECTGSTVVTFLVTDKNTITPTPTKTATVTPSVTVSPSATPVFGTGCAEVDKLVIPSDRKLAVVIVHGWQLPLPSGHDYFADIAERVRKTGVEPSVLHWEDAAGIFPGQSELINNESTWYHIGLGPRTSEAKRIGRCVAFKLLGFERVHFITHSLGSWLVDAAADILTPQGTKTHLTFLDSYVPNSSLVGALGDNATYAEQFVSRPADGWVIHTNEILPDAHNFDVTDSLHQKTAEHSWPIEWYAKSTSPGFNDSWEVNPNFNGHATYPEYSANKKVDCLVSLKPGCPFSSSEFPAAQIPPVGGIGVPTDDGKLRLKASSRSASQRSTQSMAAAVFDQAAEGASASAVLRLPSSAAGVSADMVIGVTGDGGGSMELQFGSGRVTTVVFGPEGFDGELHAAAERSSGESEVRLTLRATGDATVVAEIATITTYGTGGGVAPLPPNTGTTAENTGTGYEDKALQAAVLLALVVGLLGASAVALRRR